MSSRPYLSWKFDRLAKLVQDKQGNIEILKLILQELWHRKSGEAEKLAAQVSSMIKKMDSKNPSFELTSVSVEPTLLDGLSPKKIKPKDAEVVSTVSAKVSNTEEPDIQPSKPSHAQVETSPEQHKLTLLMEYLSKVIKLGDKPVFQIKDYRKAGFPDFSRAQQEIEGLYEVHLDTNDAWLCLPRLRRQEPPIPPEDLQSWVVIKSSPHEEPVLRDEIIALVSTKEKDRLIKEEILLPAEAEPSMDNAKQKSGFWDITLHWEKQPQSLHDICKEYLAEWKRWQSKELPKIPTIDLYQKLHSLLQRLQLGDSSQPVELVWGLGRCLWKAPITQPENAGKIVDLPCLEVRVTLHMEENGEIKVVPEELPPVLNLDAFQAFQLPGFSSALQHAQKTMEKQLETYGELNPFQAETFMPVLDAVRNHIDPGAQFAKVEENEGKLPSTSDIITITDAWILYVRPRREHVILQDITRLSEKIATTPLADLPELAARLVKEPGSWDGTSSSHADGLDEGGNEWGITENEELFFPKAYNDEQVAVVRALDNSNGVVVQGPPGTGKTHTIANLISHYMAIGQKVLVVSKKEPALRVLKEQLPTRLQGLVISLLMQEHAGSKQLEKAVEELQNIATQKTPKQLQDEAAALKSHATALRQKIKSTEEALAKIATSHLSGYGPEKQKPAELARKLLESAKTFSWFTDRPPHLSQELSFSQNEIEALRKSLKRVGSRIGYLDKDLPFINQLAATDDIVKCHRSLCRIQELSQKADDLPKIKVTKEWQEDLQAFIRYSGKVQEWQRYLNTHSWVERALTVFHTDTEHPLCQVLRDFYADLTRQLDKHAQFVKQPVSVPAQVYSSTDLKLAIERQSQGQSAFPITRTLLMGKEKALLGEVRIAGMTVKSEDGWRHVQSFIEWEMALFSLLVRWDAMKEEFAVTETPVTSKLKVLQEIREVLRALQIMADDVLPEYLKLGSKLFSSQGLSRQAICEPQTLRLLIEASELELSKLELATANDKKQDQLHIWQKRTGPLAEEFQDILRNGVGLQSMEEKELSTRWQTAFQELSALNDLLDDFSTIRDVLEQFEAACATQWSQRLKQPEGDADVLLPANWAEAWDWAATWQYLAEIDQRDKIQKLHDLRETFEGELRQTLAKIVEVQTHYELHRKLTPSVRMALTAFTNAMKKIGKGTGTQSGLHRRNARAAMNSCYGAVPCWIMPSHRVSEHLPSELGTFDLVIIDEASQSDITELPALLRGKKVLVVGDDKQVTPLQVGIGGNKIQQLQFHFLNHFPANHQGFLSVDSSIYDLMRYLYAQQPIMLREHFRCVEPIIRFSMQFYDNRLIPLRVPSASERLDPPLVDIHIPWGRRSEKGVKTNAAEAKVIVDEIKDIVRSQPHMEYRSIGVISLIGAEQAHKINESLYSELTEEEITRHKIMCGDSATFQGNERDIVFLSMVHDGQSKSPQSADQPMYQQRFNVALSRARDRMVLVRSLKEEDLSQNDLKLKVLQHFKDPMPHLGRTKIGEKQDLFNLCESGFEKDMLKWLLEQGYAVTPQVGAEGFRIDFVVESTDGKRLAIECDGDTYHGPEAWRSDLRRQRILERVGWKFWRCWASSFYLYRDEVLADLKETLDTYHIYPREDEFTGYRFTETRVIEQPETHQNTIINELLGTDMRISLAGILEEAPSRPDAAVVKVGTRITVQYTDDKRNKEYLFQNHNPENLPNIITPESPLGRALSDAGEEEAEFEFQLSKEHKTRRGIILRVENI
jgi:very-short-patch-repair endonuclease/KaiC/GvpD/RAD55 family RecA-like ATPase